MLTEKDRAEFVKGAEKMDEYIAKVFEEGITVHQALYVIYSVYSIILRHGNDVAIPGLVRSSLDFADKIHFKEEKK